MGSSLVTTSDAGLVTGVSMLWPVMSVIIAQTLCYLFCQLKKDNSYIDVAWSLTFLLPNYVITGTLID